jgi:hypothetical protein
MDRLTYLRKKYVESFKLSDRDFNRILRTDPTTIVKQRQILKVGKYCQWILNINSHTLAPIMNELVLVEDVLSKFDRIKHLLKPEQKRH